MRPRASILEGPGMIFRDFWLLGRENAGTDFELAAKAARFQLGARVARSSHSNIELQPRFSQEGWPAVNPPWGSSMELALKASKNYFVRPFLPS